MINDNGTFYFYAEYKANAPYYVATLIYIFYFVTNRFAAAYEVRIKHSRDDKLVTK